MRRFTLLACALLCTGCSHSTSPPTPGDLAIQRARWRSHAIASYDYDFTHSSEWFPPRTDRVSVRNGVVAKIVDLATGDSIGPTAHWPGMTMDDLFDRAAKVLEDAGTEDDLTFELRFDPTLHYVRQLSADRANWADDVWWYSTANLRPR